MNADYAGAIRQALESTIQKLLIDSSARPIVGADQAGAFPAAPFGSVVTQTTFLVVPDTNYLLRDIANACRSGRRVLVNAANNGLLRLYAPQHVFDEVYEKADETCERETRDRGFIAVDDFIANWESEYRPLLRCVDDVEALTAILTPNERARIAQLRIDDPDDVPCAILSIALNAFFLSWDKDALRAVYGRKPQQQELHDQILTLMDGGRVSKVSEMVALFFLLPASIFHTLGDLFGWIHERAPWAPWLLVAAAVGIVATRSPEQRSSLGSFSMNVLKVVGELSSAYEDAIARLETSGPGDPTWSSLFESVGRRPALLRAVLHTLARYPDGIASAKQLARQLPDINVGQGEKLVRDVLHANACFENPYLGKWQVARPIDPR